MVQFINVPTPRRSLLKEQIGQNIGKGLSEFMGSYFANKSLEKTLNDPTYKDAPSSEKMSRLQAALTPYGEQGKSILMNRMQTLQQEAQEQEQGILGKMNAGEPLSKDDLAKVRPEHQLKFMQMQQNKKVASNMKQALKNAGIPNEDADRLGDLYENATEGGKTLLMGTVNDLIRRGKAGQELGEASKEGMEPKPEEEGEWTPAPVLKGMTDSEKVKQSFANQKVNVDAHNKALTKLAGLEEEADNIARLQQLEATGQLPEGLEKWDINWDTGEPRIGAATLTPEAQLYLKTIAVMLGGAKNFFPGRVTNFDLQTFKRRFPTLANSKEGRILISKQLELANKIAYLKDDLYKQAVENYGSSGDPVWIRKQADKKYKEMKPQLEERLKNLDGLLDQEFRKNEANQKRVGKVPPGTKLDANAIDKFLSLTDKNLSNEQRAAQAEKMAREAGYEF